MLLHELFIKVLIRYHFGVCNLLGDYLVAFFGGGEPVKHSFTSIKYLQKNIIP
ncbi:hypothetical protein SDC9_187614 [bioreactor metagenome]|uniref:Uncharacterized protein n=1 Tax=bioreactor metagenome TaxID=1076179 RepID=A0A645HPB1_9ZZZZ